MAVMDVTVQWVRTTWSKLSRGAPNSTVRSRAPERGYRPLVTIRRGESMRWQINNRHTSYSGNWFYEMRTVNVAFGSVAQDAFLDKPDHLVDERAVLL